MVTLLPHRLAAAKVANSPFLTIWPVLSRVILVQCCNLPLLAPSLRLHHCQWRPRRGRSQLSPRDRIWSCFRYFLGILVFFFLGFLPRTRYGSGTGGAWKGQQVRHHHHHYHQHHCHHHHHHHHHHHLHDHHPARIIIQAVLYSRLHPEESQAKGGTNIGRIEEKESRTNIGQIWDKSMMHSGFGHYKPPNWAAFIQQKFQRAAIFTMAFAWKASHGLVATLLEGDWLRHHLTEQTRTNMSAKPATGAE